MSVLPLLDLMFVWFLSTFPLNDILSASVCDGTERVCIIWSVFLRYNFDGVFEPRMRK